LGKNEEHVRLFVKQEKSEGFAAIGFNLAQKIDITQKSKLFEAVYSIDENEWNGNISLQLKLRDFK
jgi:single-stranded-DNA-specific exonuclease